MTLHKNSRSARLAALMPMDTLWVETTLKSYQNDMRMWNVAKSRRPAELEGREFRTSLFTAVSAANVGRVQYLIRVERIK